VIAEEKQKPSPLPGPRRRGRIALALALATAALAAVIVALPRSGDRQITLARPAGRPPVVSTAPGPLSAQTVLYRAAREIVGRPWHPLGVGEWEYYHFVISDPLANGHARIHPDFVEDVWLASDGAARVVQYSDYDVLLIGSARSELRRERKLQRRTTHFQVVARRPPWPPEFSYHQIVSLASSIPALRHWIYQHVVAIGGRGEPGRLALIQLLVFDPRLNPKVAASLYRIIAKFPHTKLVGRVHDPLGRPGIAIEFRPATIDTTTRLTFDGSSGRAIALGEYSRGQHSGDPHAGTLETWWALSGESVVRSDHTIP
jgi:hypothetical protein